MYLFGHIPDDDHEHCGVLLGVPDRRRGTDRQVPKEFEVLELPNRHPSPHREFVVWASDADQALRERGTDRSAIIGFWHSHPSPSFPWPSRDDWAGIRTCPDAWWHVVYHPATRKLTWFDNYDNEEEVEDGFDNVWSRSGARVGGVRRSRQPR